MTTEGHAQHMTLIFQKGYTQTYIPTTLFIEILNKSIRIFFNNDFHPASLPNPDKIHIKIS